MVIPGKEQKTIMVAFAVTVDGGIRVPDRGSQVRTGFGLNYYQTYRAVVFSFPLV
jgi:hypothetical protein